MSKKSKNVISELTEAQQAQMSVYRDKWLKIGLSCEPIVFEAAVDAVKLTIERYNTHIGKDKGLDFPTEYVYARSPKEAYNMAKERFPKLSANEFLNNTIWGCHDAAWISFYDYMKEVVGLVDLEIIDGFVQLVMNSGWVTIVNGVCIIQDRPSMVKFDDRGTTHCENGPAIEYRDGYGVMVWHGQRVPREWITKGVNAKEALRVDNTELRRAACEIAGWANILEQLNCVVIDEDSDPEIGALLEVDLPINNSGTESKERFLLARCGTNRVFALPVPPDMNTALEANAWTFNIKPNLLTELEIRT